VAAHFKNGRLERVVSKKSGSTSYYVSADHGLVTEEAIAATLLTRS